MSIKDLEPLQPSSPFYPSFIPTGIEIPPLLVMAIRNSATILSTSSGQIQVTQAMGLPLTVNVVFFTVQNVGQNTVSVPIFNPFIKISDVDYSSVTDDMTWYIDWNSLASPNTPVYLCSVYYYL
jgi:hypothetical protein